MPLNLDVSLRLLDTLSRPAADATKSLDRFGAAADRLAARAKALTPTLRGLAGAVRELRAVDAALEGASASTGRLRGTMTGVGNAGRTSTAGLSSFTRAVGKLATNAEKAAMATDKLLGSIKTQIGETFVDRQNTALREQVKLLAEAARLSNRLGNAGNGGGGRRGMGGNAGGGGRVPGVMMPFQPDMRALHGLYEQASDLQDAIIRMHGMGLSDAEIARVRARADEVAKSNKSTTPLRVINSIMEARSATGGNMDASIKLAPELANADQVFSRFLPKEKAGTAHEALYDMVRAGELRNEINDPERLHKMFESMIATTVYTQGRTSPRDYHKNLIYGRGAAQGWSDSFTNDVLPFFMQELKTGPNGGQAGVGLQAVFRNVALGVRKKENDGEWRRIGMMDSLGKIADENLAISDPNIFLAKVHRGMIGAGITGHEDQVKEYGKLFGTGTAQTMSMIGGFQQDRLDSYLRTKKSVIDSEGLVNLANLTLSQSTDNLKASFETLEGNVGSVLTPTMTAFTDSATRAVRALNFMIAPLGQNGNDPKNGSTPGTTYGLLGSGAAFAGAILAASIKRFPMLGRLVGAGAGIAATGGTDIAGGAVAGNIAGEAAASALKGVSMGTLVGAAKGGFAGIMLSGIEIVADRLISRLAPVLPSEKKKAFDAHQKRWDDAWIWQKPGLIWQDAFGSHETTAPTANVSGARAKGGPVMRGLSYLVGERGPELFTPGLTGGITNHAVLGMMASGGGGTGGSDLIARALRFMSFDLVSVLNLLVSRLRVGGENGSGTGLYGSGTGGSSGAGSGGRGGDGGTGRGDEMPPSKLVGAGLSERSVGSGKDAFDLGGIKRQSLALRSIDSNAFSGSIAGSSNPRLASNRKSYFDELDRNPSLRRDVMKTASMENGRSGSSMTSVLESMVNRAQMRGYHSLNQSIHDGFYGPVNRGGLRGVLSEQSRRFGEEAIRNVRAGSNQIGYRTDQGLLTDPGGRKYMASGGDHSGWKKSYGENFFYMGAKGRGWAKRQEAADRAQPNAPPGSVGAFGLGGFNAPGGFSGSAQDSIPSVLRERQRHMHEERERKRAAAAKVASGGQASHGHVTINVHPHQGHNEKQIAEMVHRKFNDSVRAQLNDGAFT